MTLTPATYLVVSLVIIAAALVRARMDRRAGWRRVYDFFANVEIAGITLLLGTLVVIGVLQIILRNTLHTGILWADPLMRHIVLWLGAMGASLATSRLRHINIDVFTRLLPPRLAVFRRTVIYLATATAAFVLGVAAWRLVIDEKAFGESAFLGLDVWMLQVILPVSFFLIAYRSLVNLFLGREPRLEGTETEG